MDPRRIRSRQKLKSGLLELLKRKSLDQISIEEISVQAEVSRPTFYSNFSDSQAIVMELIEDWFEEKSQLLHALKPEETGVTMNALAAYFRYLFEIIEKEEKLLCIALSGRAGEEVLDAAHLGLVRILPSAIWGGTGFSRSNPKHIYISYGFCGIVESVCARRLQQSKQDLGLEVAKLILN